MEELAQAKAQSYHKGNSGWAARGTVCCIQKEEAMWGGQGRRNSSRQRNLLTENALAGWVGTQKGMRVKDR